MKFNKSNRHRICLLYYFFVILGFFSCSKTGNIIETNKALSFQDTCSDNINHTYEVYIPGNAKSCSRLPLLIIVDPHGDGKSALHRFIPAAEKYKCILAASDLLKNNYENYLVEINMLKNDVIAKYPTNGTIFLAGFSGGARMALSFGQRNIVDGIIACGALATRNQIITIRAPVYAITGMQDFNFIETAQYFFQPALAPANLFIELSEELHEWPSPNVLSNAIAFLILDKDAVNMKCIDGKELGRKLSENKKTEIEILKKKHDFLSALLVAKNMARLHSEADANLFESLINSLEYSQEFNNELNRLRESIRFELSVRDAYMKALLAEDLSWWKTEISSLNNNISKDKDRYRNYAYKRIKAFLGIMCYSISNKALQSNDLKNAEKLLSIYKLLEPDNPDMFYFYALYYKKKGNLRDAKSFLQKAINAGFSDQQLIKLID